MSSKASNSTKRRPASSGKKQKQTRKLAGNLRAKAPADDDENDPWLSVDDLGQPKDADDWARNGQTKDEDAADHAYHSHRLSSGFVEVDDKESDAGAAYAAAYKALIRKHGDYDSVPEGAWASILPKGEGRVINPDDPNSYDLSDTFTPEFINRCEAYEENRRWNLRHRIVDGKILDTRWVNPDLPSPERRKELEARMAELRREAADEEPTSDKSKANGKAGDDKTTTNDGDVDDKINDIKKKLKEKDPLYIKIATVFIESMKSKDKDSVRIQRFKDVDGNLHLWKYEKGLWAWLPDRTVAKWLVPILQRIINVTNLEKNSNIKVLNEAVQHITRHELVCVDSEMRFDQHGKVPTIDGLIDPITHEIEPLKPGHFATWVLPKVRYDKDAKCPNFKQMLNDALSDKPKEEHALDIQLLQDFAGMSLLDDKPKALQRGLILLGPANSGKTSLAQVLAGMLADKNKWITTPYSSLDKSHGTQAFIRRAPWVLGEAFTTSVWHMSDTVKEILGGDNIEINPKNKDAISIKPNAPAIHCTNHPPKFKEPTRAIVIRIVVMELTRVFDKTKPVGVAAAAHKANPGWWPQDLILNTERSGLLNWMLDGAKRALERQYYINTKVGEALLEGILDDSNVVRAFIKDCGTFDPSLMISTPDFMAALVSWWQEHHGDDARPPNATLIGMHMKALADPRILQNKDTFRDEAGVRFYLGIKLNTAGLSHWSSVALDDRQSGRSTKSSARMSTIEAAVTREIKPEWLSLPEVERMRKAHDVDRQKPKT